MPISQSPEPMLVQIPPHTSPVLLPSHRSTRSNSPDDFSLYSNHHNPDIPHTDDLEYLPPGQWDDQHGAFTSDDETEDGSGQSSDDDDDKVAFDEDDDIEDWTLEDGHIEGVACANVVLHAKYASSFPPSSPSFRSNPLCFPF